MNNILWLKLCDTNCVTKIVRLKVCGLNFVTKRIWFLRETMKLFWMKTIFRVKKWSFFAVNISHSISFLGVNRYPEYKDDFSFVYIPVNSQEIPSNTMARAASATPEEYFLGSSQEKRTVTALARRGETPPTHTGPAGWRTPSWQCPGCPFANPPASSSWWSIAFILRIFFRCKSSVCGLVWLAAAAAAQKLHDLSI